MKYSNRHRYTNHKCHCRQAEKFLDVFNYYCKNKEILRRIYLINYPQELAIYLQLSILKSSASLVTRSSQLALY